MPNINKATDKAADKAPAAKANATVTLTPRQAAIAAHDKAGFTGKRYAGISKTRNAASRCNINTTTSKASARAETALTDRMRASLSELAKAYGTKPFPARGLDSGQAAIFINSGFIKRHGNSGAETNGIYTDAATPLQFTLSPAIAKAYA